ERDHPDPVTESHVVIGGEPARDEPAMSKATAGARGDIVDIPHVLPAAPDGGRRVLLVAVDETEALAEKGHLAGGVEHPAAGHRLRPALVLEGHLMIEGPQEHAPTPRRPPP